MRALSGAYGSIATTASEVSTIVEAINTTSRSGIWIGQAGDAFRTKIDSLPDDARKCTDSYGIARDAMTRWASTIDDTQARADTGLNQARTAQADLEAAQHALAAALAAQSSASSTLRRTENLYDLYRDATPPAGVNVPTDWQVRQARNRALRTLGGGGGVEAA
ncbi:putative T7SS-secreted protein, partial [Microbacterium lacticum]|uniref:putative T7SS-secreted protein n=2 Tax=Microbacterium lacticum TaxID=33885 RepID=UPI001E2B64D9